MSVSTEYQAIALLQQQVQSLQQQINKILTQGVTPANVYPASDLPIASPGTTDCMVGVDEALSQLRKFKLSTLPVTQAQQYALDEMQTQVNEVVLGQSSNQIAYGAWDQLAAVTGERDGQMGQVIGDTGTHVDPVSSATVSNSGQYRWNESVKDWQWLRADTTATLAEGFQSLSRVASWQSVEGINATASAMAGAFSRRVFSGDVASATALPNGKKLITVVSATSRAAAMSAYVDITITVDGAVIRHFYLPGAAANYSNGVLYSASAAVKFSDLEPESIAETTSTMVRVRYYLPSGIVSAVSGISDMYVFDAAGTFSPGVAEAGAAYPSATVSATSGTDSIQFIVPIADITAAGFDASNMLSIHTYLRTFAASSLFLVYTGTWQATSGLDTYLRAEIPAGQCSVSVSTNASANIDVYVPAGGVRSDVGDYSRQLGDVVNDSVYSYTAWPVELKVNFAPGEVQSSECLIVTDEDGNEYPAQFSADAHPNPRRSIDVGYHADGSLAAGSLFVPASIVAGGSAAFEVRGYRTPVAHHSATELQYVNGNTVTLTFDGYTYTFGRTNAWCLSSITDQSGTVHGIGHGAYFSGWSGSAALQTQATSSSTLRVVSSGPVFVELESVSYNDETYSIPVGSLRFSTRMKIFAGGRMQIRVFATAVKEIEPGLLYGVHSRLNLTDGAYSASVASMSAVWTDATSGKNWSVSIARLNGDIHRDGTTYGPTRPTLASVLNPTATSTRLYGGWQITSNTDYSLLNYPIKKGWTWTQEIWIDGDSQQTSVRDAISSIYNRPVGFLGCNGSPYILRKSLMRKIEDFVHGEMDFWYSTSAEVHGGYDGTGTWRYRSFAYELMRHVQYGERTLDDLYNEFDSYMTAQWGGLANCGSYYESGKIVLQFASRLIIPVIEWMYRIAVREGNTTVAEHLKVAIGSFGSAIQAAWAANGYVPLNNATGGGNSNSNATGMRVIALAIYAGLDTSGSYLETFNAIESSLSDASSYMYIEGVIKDSSTDNLPAANYLHYQLYAANNYLLACDLLGRSPAFDLANYSILASSPKGGFDELDYCISESRRGDRNTITFALYGLMRLNRASALNAANSLVNALSIEAGHIPGYPKRIYGYDGTTADPVERTTSVSFCATTLAETWLASDGGLN